jgi:uncharacterized protein (TIGR03435 family)
MRRFHIAAILATALAFAQGQPVFDAASVKAASQSTGPSRTKLDSGRVVYTNSALIVFVMAAYGVNADRIAGIPNEFRYPTGYTIEATYPPGTSREQVAQMLQSLLAERFKLKVHHETRPTPVYALVIAKNGPTIKPSEAAAQSFGNMQPGLFEAKKVPLSQVVNLMHNAGWVDRTIVDQTNLTGAYDFSLKWTPDNVKPEDSTAPSIFTAVQEQWGLKLEPQTLPLDILVIDHVEKPGEN